MNEKEKLRLEFERMERGIAATEVSEDTNHERQEEIQPNDQTEVTFADNV